MPWRETRDPWAIWVSEVMLQQTRVAAVRAGYERFLARFPDPQSLADADDDALLAAWQGLGYYRRARALRAAARLVVAEHGGLVPREPEAFGALPGVGPYTRGAVLSIAFGQRVPAIDGNVERVVSRLRAIPGDPRRSAQRERIAALVAALHEQGPAGDLNQALMELGALCCLPRAPRCDACPWATRCLAQKRGAQARYPALPAREPPVAVTTRLGFATRADRLLARRVPKGEVNEGQLCLPGLGLPVPKGEDLAAWLHREHGLRCETGALLARIRHSITRYKINAEIYALLPPPKARPGRGLEWADPGDESLPWSTLCRKVLRALTRRDAALRESLRERREEN